MARLIAILFACLALLSACEDHTPPAPPSPAPAAPTRPRVVALSPAIGVILADLHFDDLCVGRHGHDMVLSPSIPVVGTQMDIDYEALISAKPTHVFTQWGSRDLPARLVELANEGHWKLMDARLLSLEDIRQTTIDLDQELCAATGRGSPSPPCKDLLARMDAAWSRHTAKGYAKVGRVLLLAASNPPAAFGPGSCHYQLLDKLGATPAITTGAAYITLDAEGVLALAPDAIILIDPRGMNTPPPSAADAAMLRETRFAAIAALDIPAVKNHRMTIIDDPLGAIPSTAMVHLAEELAQVLDGWAAEK